jgi:hypothetical protein
MNGWVAVGLTVLGGAIAGAVGLVVARYQHTVERRHAKDDAEHAAMVELVNTLLPLLAELERVLESHGYWVGRIHEMRRLGTWVFDPEENAHQAPDWDRIAEVAQQIERRWWGELQLRIADPEIRRLREEFYEWGIHVAMKDTANPRVAATRLSMCIEAVLMRVGHVVGKDLELVHDRPPRPAAPERPNELQIDEGD